ncbi:MAG TPA: hypothetical protein DCP75_09230 [Haliea salexigens]|uniref:Alginate export domain-containing protein n=1 Tax=Haliea salexigens TaxID=287487 RepID=A0A3C1KMJ0_9GAMM|nr:hypothetical protein [Haliea salexigens]
MGSPLSSGNNAKGPFGAPSVHANSLCALLLGSSLTAMPGIAAEGNSNSVASMISNGSAQLDFRYRLEYVDQAPFADTALASTLRSRLTLASADWAGVSFALEIDDVTAIGNDLYNSTTNGELRYPVVADPEGTEINRVQVDYRNGDLHGTLGRQRILHGNHRFVGNVVWRQNEQTYDGLRAQWQPTRVLQVDASYVYRVQRIFGPDDGAQPADWDGDIGLLRATWSPAEKQSLSGFAYLLDIDPDANFAPGLTVANASDTVGVEYSGQWSDFNLNLALATQSDAGDNPANYRATYYNVDAGWALSLARLEVGYEVLGSDNGQGFRTPLATLHKFQGWADKFLGTPGDGIQDAWFAVSGKRDAFNWRAVYHDFETDRNSRSLGSELDLLLGWALTPKLSLELKAAFFDGDGAPAYQDTDKVWLTAHVAF